MRRTPVLLGLAVLLAFVVLAGAELVARLLVPPSPPTYAQHPYTSHVWSPNLSLTYRTHHGAGELLTLETNAFGFRGKRLRTVEKPAGTIRVFFGGASVIVGIDCTEAESIPGLVESGLDERLHGSPAVECVNAALSGVGIEHTFASFAHLMLPFAPDYLVLYEGLNDELESVDPRFDPTHYSERREATDTLTGWFNAHIRLMQVAARHRMAEGKNPFVEHGNPLNERPIESWPKLDLEPGFRDWRRYLAMIEAIAQKTGVKLVLVTQGCLWKESMSEAELGRLRYAYRYGDRISVPELTRLHRRYMDEVRSFARAGGHILVDAEPLLPKDEAHFADDFHLTDESNRIVARAVADAIAHDR
jgi:hypothetical protein